MRIPILIPMYGVGHMVAHTVHKLLKHKGKHQIDIVIIDNKGEIDDFKFLEPFEGNGITVVKYPKNLMQSHSLAFDYVLNAGLIKSSHFITLESDSFPQQDNWLDHYEDLINWGYDMAGSKLLLSGGEYIHPCGCLYSVSLWQEAKKYCDSLQYRYLPNMGMKEDFACHLMIHKSIFNEVIASPEDYIVLADGYKPYHPDIPLTKEIEYKPVVGPFHNGMGKTDESIHTYGMRSLAGAEDVILDNKLKLIHRIGYEPGQWLSYYAKAMNKKIFEIPTETKWLNNKPGVQQEYTIMENGFKHLWAGTSYLFMKDTASHDIYEFKHKQVSDLYDSLPEHLKIK